jgi:hypothetical protein
MVPVVIADLIGRQVLAGRTALAALVHRLVPVVPFGTQAVVLLGTQAVVLLGTWARAPSSAVRPSWVLALPLLALEAWSTIQACHRSAAADKMMLAPSLVR